MTAMRELKGKDLLHPLTATLHLETHIGGAMKARELAIKYIVYHQGCDAKEARLRLDRMDAAKRARLYKQVKESHRRHLCRIKFALTT